MGVHCQSHLGRARDATQSGRVWGQLSEEGLEPTKRTVKAIADHFHPTKGAEISTHTFKFFKEHNGTDNEYPIRIAWYDNFGSGGGNTHARWEVYIDGAQCDTRSA